MSDDEYGGDMDDGDFGGDDLDGDDIDDADIDEGNISKCHRSYVNEYLNRQQGGAGEPS